jgi:hypothetical protein
VLLCPLRGNKKPARGKLGLPQSGNAQYFKV